jgi:hypothetical protein
VFERKKNSGKIKELKILEKFLFPETNLRQQEL